MDQVKPHPYVKRPAAAEQSETWDIPSLCDAYQWPSGLAGGGVIAIVELGGGWNKNDVAQAFAEMNLPVPTITDVSVDGTNNTPGGDADMEVALDIQCAAAAYTKATGQAATIRMYWAQDIASAVAMAASDRCDVCSISWGADEAEWGAVAGQAMDRAAMAANAGGMTVFAAAGDNDSSDGGNTPANVDLPASCPHVVACGGTRKPHTGAETVWNDNPGASNGEGTGGGYSTLFPVQSWQVGAPLPSTGHVSSAEGWWQQLEDAVRHRRPPVTGSGRMVPDLAANADPNTGYQIVLNGQVAVVGGTSAVAPLMAGLFAAFGTKLGWINPKLWANQTAFTDITQGSNGVYSAAVGPDACSGIGSPIGTKLASALA